MTRLVKFANNAVSRLAGNITNIATTLTITPGDGAKFPALGAGEHFAATLVKADGTLEIVKVTARSTDTLTIARAIEPVGGVQTAHSFSAGDKIELRLTAGSVGSELDRLETAIGNYVPKAGGTMTGALGFTGAAVNEAEGNAIASATTVDLNAATGNFLHITGTTAITTVTLGQGRERTVVFDGALTLTNGASLILPTGANITTAAGDVAVFRGEGTGVTRCVAYTRASGQPIATVALANGGTGATTQAAALQALGTLGNITVAKTGAYTVIDSDRGDVILCSGTFSLTLTAAATLKNGFSFGVVNTGTGTITIDPNASETVDGAGTKVLKPGQSAILITDGSLWRTVGLSGSGATGGGADEIFYENGQTVNADYTITSGKNAMSAGPITIASGITVTVPSGSTWVVA